MIGSSQAIVAAVGDDVILPCYVEPPFNVEELMVDWWRPDIPPDPTDHLSQYKYVHHYYEKRNVEDMKMSSYAGRTSLFEDELKNGNASLKITNVKLSDQGRYRCVVPQLGSSTVVKLIVGKCHFFCFINNICCMETNTVLFILQLQIYSSHKHYLVLLAYTNKHHYFFVIINR